MGLSVIDKYIEKKQKDILDYAKILESIITLQDNKMWNNKNEFATKCREIINLYAKNYYFDNNNHRNNPIEFCNDNVNLILKVILEFFKNKNESDSLKDQKNEVFLLTIILCTAIYLDISTNVIDGNVTDTKNKFKYLLQYFQKIQILKVYVNDRVRINDLFDLIRKNNKEDSKAFELFVDNNYKNTYTPYTTTPTYYLVNFEYRVDGLEDFDGKLVNKVRKTFLPKLINISFNLLNIDLLKELISNREMKIYLIKMNDLLNKKNNLFKVFDNELLKKYIKVIIPFEKDLDYADGIKELERLKIPVIYEYTGTDHVKDGIFTYDLEIITNKTFLTNNEDNEMLWKKNGIKFVIKNMED